MTQTKTATVARPLRWAWSNVWDVAKGVGYTAISPIEGYRRGFAGHNTPLPYRSLNSNGDGRYGNTPGGYAAAALNASVGTAGAAVPWAVTRAGRWLVADGSISYPTYYIDAKRTTLEDLAYARRWDGPSVRGRMW